MSSEDFQLYSVPEIRTFEGGNVDDPDDPGGRTGQGITQKVYNAWRRNQKLPPADVFKITPAEWSAIIKTQYWDACQCDDLPEGIDYVVCDGAVNSGPVESIKWLQFAAGVKVDGILGQATMAAVKANVNNDVLIGIICDQRLRFMKELKTWKKYKNGWTSRVNHVRTKGQSLATGTVGASAVYFAGGDHKARIEDAKPAPSKSLGDATGSTGTTAVVLTQVQAALAPAATWEPVAHILTGVAVFGGLIGVAGFGYSAYARWREGKINAAFLLDQPATAIVSTGSSTPGTIPVTQPVIVPTPVTPPDAPSNAPSIPVNQYVLPSGVGYVTIAPQPLAEE